MYRLITALCCAFAGGFFQVCLRAADNDSASSDSPPRLKAELRFDRDVRPILSDKCFHCHGPDQENRQADLRLDVEDEARYVLESNGSELCDLIARIETSDPDLLMPPPEAKKPLSESEKAILRQWISQGAPWSQHWSFRKPEFVSPTLESSTRDQSTIDTDWAVNPIDHYVLAKLREQGLAPSPEASKTTLIRRLTYDLTGLPPTLEEIDAYLNDDREEAYEQVVDRLLSSQHYGERMAVMWLDAARYGDTSVYHADGPRDMWAWRDTVVKAYNENMPFDQFSIAQLAADLLPNATLDEQILGGFNRNNGTTDEGGAFAEEYRVEYCVDRVKTTSTIWLGLTMECAQCHDHKYDPISQKEYYEFYAFFNVSADKGMQTRNGNAEPILKVPNPESRKKIPIVEQERAKAHQALTRLREESTVEFEQWAAAEANDLESASELLENLIFNTSLTPVSSGTDEDKNAGEGQIKIASEWVDSNLDLTPKAAGQKTAKQEATEQEDKKQENAEPQDADQEALLQRREHIGTVTGKTQVVDSPQGKGMKFEGGYVDFGNVADFERDQAFSYGAWIKSDNLGGAILARMDDSNEHRGFDLYLAGGRVSMHLIHSWPGNALKVTTKKKLKANEWAHVMVTYDGSSKASGVNIYVNGENWPWDIEQDGLKDSVRTEKSLLVASRHPGSRYRGEIDSVQIFSGELAPSAVESLAQQGSVLKTLSKPRSEWTESEREHLQTYYLNKNSEPFRKLRTKITSLDQRIAELQKPLTTVMVMRDMETPRDTFILNRGAYDSPTEEKVTPSTLSALPPMSDDLPRNRLGLARWLFGDNQPLTARVTVNRYWQLLFGRGLVDTPGDFGAQGSYPSHPELLDWLAIDFRENGWNVKRTIKQIVMSATYRQSSAADTYGQDRSNQWLSRGPRFRLQGEFIRDTALTLSGLMDTKIGGPGVKPYQPPGLWVEVGLSGKPAFKQDHDSKLYRRSLYTYWKRSAPPPSMQIFDAPTREKCTLQRPTTNTPLQALVVLNDPQYIEAARGFAERILQQPELDEMQKIQFAFRSATARLPTDSESQTLMRILRTSEDDFRKEPESAEQLLNIGESSRDKRLDPAIHAAWTVVASTILNLDETLTRE